MRIIDVTDMKTKSEMLKTLKANIPYIRENFHVKSIGLFGSYARGEQREESDVDMLVEFEKPVGFFEFIGLEDYLTGKLGVKVELVTPDALKPLIKPSVIREVVYA